MANVSRPTKDQEILIEHLEQGKASEAQQKAAAKVLLEQISRADNNAQNNTGLQHQISGMSRVIEIYANGGGK